MPQRGNLKGETLEEAACRNLGRTLEIKQSLYNSNVKVHTDYVSLNLHKKGNIHKVTTTLLCLLDILRNCSKRKKKYLIIFLHV